MKPKNLELFPEDDTLISPHPLKSVSFLARRITNFVFPARGLRLIESVIQVAYVYQHPFESRHDFTQWVRIAVGDCRWLRGPHGGIVPIVNRQPLSAYSEARLNDLAKRIREYLESDHAASYLWPRFGRLQINTQSACFAEFSSTH